MFSCIYRFLGATLTDAILSHEMLIVIYASGYVSVFLCLQVFGASITDAILSHIMLIIMYASGYVQCFLVFTGVLGQYEGCHPIS